MINRKYKKTYRFPTIRIQASSNLGVDNWYRPRFTDNFPSTLLDSLCTLIDIICAYGNLVEI
jgi:hypothetical protein